MNVAQKGNGLNVCVCYLVYLNWVKPMSNCQKKKMEFFSVLIHCVSSIQTFVQKQLSVDADDTKGVDQQKQNDSQQSKGLEPVNQLLEKLKDQLNEKMELVEESNDKD